MTFFLSLFLFPLCWMGFSASTIVYNYITLYDGWNEMMRMALEAGDFDEAHWSFLGLRDKMDTCNVERLYTRRV